MIDWLINILYNIGMIVVLIGVIFYLQGKAERTPEGANYYMLQELRKLNRLQREQIELEKTAPVQVATPPLTQ